MSVSSERSGSFGSKLDRALVSCRPGRTEPIRLAFETFCPGGGRLGFIQMFAARAEQPRTRAKSIYFQWGGPACSNEGEKGHLLNILSNLKANRFVDPFAPKIHY